VLSSDALSSVADTTEEVVCLKTAFSPDSYRFWAIDRYTPMGLFFSVITIIQLEIIDSPFRPSIESIVDLIYNYEQ